MTRHRCRYYWQFLSLLVILATMIGFLNVQKNYCILTTKVEMSDDTNTDRDNIPLNVDADKFITPNLIYPINQKYLFFSSHVLVENITKKGDDFFEILGEETYLANDSSVFIKGNVLKNNFSDNFIIKGENICQGTAPFLLVIIPSVASNVNQRDAIRWTWLKAAETNSWPRAVLSEKIKHIFLFGRRNDIVEDDYKQLSEEYRTLGDIVMADFEDSYRNLTRKILVGLSWARQYCPNAQFVLKADEDTFINVPLMANVLHQLTENTKKEAFVMGLQHGYQQPYVVREGRWGVKKEEYPIDFYPKYLYGHTYVVNMKAVIDLTDTARYVTLIAPEDAFITGILPKTANIVRISAPCFTVCCRKIYDCEVVWNRNVALPEVKSPAKLAKLWTNVINHICNDTVPFLE